MEMHSKQSNFGEPEALDTIEAPLRRSHHNLYPLFAPAESPMLNYWRIIVKRRWWIGATLVVIFSLSVVKTLRTTRLYQATSQIAISPENPNVLGFKYEDAPPADYQSDAALETQAAILRSDTMAMKVIENIHLDQDPRFAGVNPASTPADAIRLSST